MKFKVGDKVRIIRPNIFLKEPYKNKVYTIIKNATNFYDIKKSFDLNDNSSFRWFEDELELVKDNKKFFKTLPNNYTGTIEVVDGYITEKEILDEVEKEYLKAVIKPFKNRVAGISKEVCVDGDCYINIDLLNECINFPYFKKETMYRGMEPYKIYTLKELGLDV